MDLVQRIQNNFRESSEINMQSAELLATTIVRAADLITDCLLNEGKILSCGNGGSAADAQRFAGNMLNGFQMERPGLPAIALTGNSSAITAIANEFQYADIFSKQIRSLGQPGDILLVITTSGESHNIIHSVDAAHERNMNIVALTGQEGGLLADLLDETDIEIRVQSWSTPRIHETHLIILHCICDLVDHRLLGVEE